MISLFTDGILREAQGKPAHFNLPASADGQYWLSLRAIAAENNISLPPNHSMHVDTAVARGICQRTRLDLQETESLNTAEFEENSWDKVFKLGNLNHVQRKIEQQLETPAIRRPFLKVYYIKQEKDMGNKDDQINRLRIKPVVLMGENLYNPFEYFTWDLYKDPLLAFPAILKHLKIDWSDIKHKTAVERIEVVLDKLSALTPQQIQSMGKASFLSFLFKKQTDDMQEDEFDETAIVQEGTRIPLKELINNI
jgi:hypothetical protein